MEGSSFLFHRLDFCSIVFNLCLTKYCVLVYNKYNSLDNKGNGSDFMKCPFCGFEESKVIDSRPADEGQRIRRRRECIQCSRRFTTYEIIESVPIVVVKKDQSREVFDRMKLFNGILRACEKRPVSTEEIEKAVDEIELTIQNSLDREVTSIQIGELAMDKLKDIDDVAYVRFASVYRQFKDINTFMDELSKILTNK